MSAWKFLSVIKGVQCLEAADGVGAAREAKTWRLSAARRRSFTVPVKPCAWPLCQCFTMPHGPSSTIPPRLEPAGACLAMNGKH